jgi:hypothetical protein
MGTVSRFDYHVVFHMCSCSAVPAVRALTNEIIFFFPLFIGGVCVCGAGDGGHAVPLSFPPTPAGLFANVNVLFVLPLFSQSAAQSSLLGCVSSKSLAFQEWALSVSVTFAMS